MYDSFLTLTSTSLLCLLWSELNYTVIKIQSQPCPLCTVWSQETVYGQWCECKPLLSRLGWWRSNWENRDNIPSTHSSKTNIMKYENHVSSHRLRSEIKRDRCINITQTSQVITDHVLGWHRFIKQTHQENPNREERNTTDLQTQRPPDQDWNSVEWTHRTEQNHTKHRERWPLTPPALNFDLWHLVTSVTSWSVLHGHTHNLCTFIQECF